MKFAYLLGIFALWGCTKSADRLPVLGNHSYQQRMEDGQEVTDTLFHTINDFQFVDQDSNLVSNSTFDGKIYIADFFFTSCPSICPIMKTQMLRVYEAYQENDMVVFLSHTIDPEYDTVALLKDYADRLGVESSKWHFVTGNKQDIFKIAQLSYMSVAADDAEAPGGYIHSGRFLLVDPLRRIRGAYDGTDPKDVDILIQDIETLLQEYVP